MKKDFAKKWGEVVTSWPKLFTLLSVLVALGLGFGGKNLTMSSDYRYFFGEDNPQRLAFENLQDIYSKDDSVLILITPKDKKVFKRYTLNAIANLTENAWKLPFSTRVDSVTNFQYSKAIEDDLVVKDLVTADELLTGTVNYKEVKQIAINEPLLKDRLINPDGSVTAINVTMNFPGKSPFEVPEAAAATRELVKKWEKEFPDHDVKLSGLVMLNNAFNEAGMKDMMTLTPLMYLVIIVIMFIMIRTITGVVATFGVLFLSILSGMGFAGWAGIPITPPSSIAPIIILTLAIADSIHILKSILALMAKGIKKQEAIIEGLRVNFRPVFLTSFTTAIGFLSLNFSDTPPFHDLGNISAVGVTMAFFLSVVMLPAILTILPVKTKAEKVVEQTKLAQLGKYVTRHSTAVILSTIFITVFLGFQIPKIDLNDQFVEYFGEDNSFRTASEYSMKNLTGIYAVNYDLKSGESQGISDPAYLKKMDEFSNYLRSIPGVVHVNSLVDTMKRLNKNMHGDRKEYYTLPTSREMASQYLLLYEMSLPYGLDLNNQIDIDKSSSRVIVTLGNLKTAEMLAINEKAEQWLVTNAPEHMRTLGSSPAIMFSHVSERNVVSMAWATLFAFILITFVMIFALRSVKYGLLSLLPNVIPAIIGYGLWSIFVGEAGFAIAVVGSVTLGIVVDDTVHFLAKYALAKKENNFSADEAVKYAFENVGSALIATSVILVIGFSILMFSTFKMNFILGALSALTIGVALIIDFTFLPAVLYLMDKEKNKTGDIMKAKNITAVIFVGLLAFGFSNSVFAKENKGLWVANQIDKADSGFINQVAKTKMILRNKKGQESIREMRIKTLEVQNDGDKSLTIFDSPRDVKGTAFLSYSHSVKSDDQWLYMPAIKRVKSISSNNKSGPFMGSEFAYEDISSQEVDKYTYKFIKEETVLGEKGYVIERYPVDKKSGYTKQVVWVDGKEWRVARIDFYDRKATLLKTLVYKGYKKYDNGKWRPASMEMKNHQNEKSTSLIWKEIKFGRDLSKRDFDKNALKRIR